MYLSGPSVLACCAGKAVLILILPPSIFKPARRSGMSITLLHYAQVVCCGNTLVAENGNESYSLCRPYPGGPLGPWGPPQLLSPSGRYVFAWCPMLVVFWVLWYY